MRFHGQIVMFLRVVPHLHFLELFQLTCPLCVFEVSSRARVRNVRGRLVIAGAGSRGTETRNLKSSISKNDSYNLLTLVENTLEALSLTVWMTFVFSLA